MVYILIIIFCGYIFFEKMSNFVIFIGTLTLPNY